MSSRTPPPTSMLLRQIADASGGQSIPPEQLPKYLKSLKGKIATESYSQTEKQDLGQLAVPDPLRDAVDDRVVGSQASRMGLSNRLGLLIWFHQGESVSPEVTR